MIMCLGFVKHTKPLATTCGYVALTAGKQLLVSRALGYVYQKAFIASLKLQEALATTTSSDKEKDVARKQTLAHILALASIVGSQYCFESLVATTEFGRSAIVACDGARLQASKYVGTSCAKIVKIPENLGALDHCANFLGTLLGISCGMNAMTQGREASREFWYEKATWRQKLQGYGRACMSSAGLLTSSALLQFVINPQSRSAALLLGMYEVFSWFSPMYALPNSPIAS